MRTTVTLDPDVVLLLEKEQRQKHLTFKETLNEAIRTGLTRRVERRRFRTATARMGRPAVDLDKALQVAAELDDEKVVRELQRDS